MNRALLDELQRQRCYPSITVLFNTEPDTILTTTEIGTAVKLANTADARLEGDVGEQLRTSLVTRLTDLILDQAREPSGHALALFVSPEHASAVRLGRRVEPRVVIDDTFATRDLVADLNRSALFRVVTISERACRLFIGDRRRLIERREDAWPLTRGEAQSPGSWSRYVATHLRSEQAFHPLPTVVAGVQRSVRQVVAPAALAPIGLIPGNHDRTSWVELHHAAWPMVTDWLRTDQERAIQQLDQAISTSRFCGGIDEVWALANDGRIETVVVEESYAVAARIGADLQLLPATDRDHPEVVDDVVDDTIEVVLRQGGNAVIVDDGVLAAHHRIAAVLRY